MLSNISLLLITSLIISYFYTLTKNGILWQNIVGSKGIN